MTRKQPSPQLIRYLELQGEKLATRTKWVDTIFPRMVIRWGLIEAIERLMKQDIQPGFTKCIQLGLAECTFEAAVLEFPHEFSRTAVECAKWRLEVSKAA